MSNMINGRLSEYTVISIPMTYKRIRALRLKSSRLSGYDRRILLEDCIMSATTTDYTPSILQDIDDFYGDQSRVLNLVDSAYNEIRMSITNNGYSLTEFDRFVPCNVKGCYVKLQHYNILEI